MKLTQFIRNLSVGLSLFCVISTAYAAYPLWTFTPDPNYPPKISITSTQAGIVVYSVQKLVSQNKIISYYAHPRGCPSFTLPIDSQRSAG